MSDLPSPIEGSGSSDSDHSTHTESDESLSGSDMDNSSEISEKDTYVLRLTPLEKYSRQEAIGWLNAKFQKWFISTEGTPQLHFHVVFETEDLEEDVRKIVKDFVYNYWPAPRPRGFGNKQYNLQLSETPDLAIRYAAKHRDYEYYGYSDDYITEQVNLSFLKSKEDFQSDLIKLKLEFHNTPMTSREFMIRLNWLSSKYGRNVNIATVYQTALSVLIAREPEQSAVAVDNFLDRLGLT